MPKTAESLRQSRDDRQRALAEFGNTRPDSILRHDKSWKAKDLMANGRAYKNGQQWVGSFGDKWKSRAFHASGSMKRGKGGTLSRFPQNVGRTLLLFYTQKGDWVFDPFAGHNSRMEMTWRAQRNYHGCDLSAEFMRMNRQLREEFLSEYARSMFPNGAQIFLWEGDSRKVPMEDSFYDFTITSPPYWDIEHYGDEPEQLGAGKSYREFLEGLGKVAKENYRVLRPGAFCVWCVNDFRKGGRFYSYHEHTGRLLRDAGFIQHDIAIVDLGSSIRQNFMNQAIEQKILPKRHEYALVYRKPEDNRKK